MLTETEAKTKWCPFISFRGTPSDDSIPNRNPSYGTNCIASACMAWRWENQRLAEDVIREGRKLETAMGYCGAFGQPR